MVQVIKCPSCGANMRFDAERQKMHCEYCDREIDVQDIGDGSDDQEEEEEDSGGTADFKIYTCPNCGAELLTDEHTIATFCNFCGDSSLIEDRVQGELMPAQLIPFKISKEEAKDIYKAWTKKGLLTPGDFKKASTIEKISGVYVPFWLYDYHSRAKLTAVCTRVRREVHGDVEYIHTDNFRVVRDIHADYLKVPADASKKMPDDIMDKLEPFHYGDMQGFEVPYLSGYLAEKYNYTSEELASRIETRVNEYIYKAARDTINAYSTVNIVDRDTRLQRKNAKYTLFPVWMLNYRYKGKDYIIAINGQTKKIVGSLPISKQRAAGWFFGITIVGSAVLLLLGGIFG